jgi:hypothetical protein
MLFKYTYNFLENKIKDELNYYMERDFTPTPELLRKMHDHINHNKEPNNTAKELLENLEYFEKVSKHLNGKELKAYSDVKNAYWYKLAAQNVATKHVVDHYISRFRFDEDYMVYDGFEKAKARYYLWKYYVSWLINQFPEVEMEIYKHADKAHFSAPDYTDRDKLIKEKRENYLSFREEIDLQIKILEYNAIQKAIKESLRGGLSLEEFNKLSPDKQNYRMKMQKRYNSAVKIGVKLEGGLISDIQNIAKIVINFLKRKEQDKAYEAKKANNKIKYDSDSNVVKKRKAKIDKWRRIYESYNSDVNIADIARKEGLTSPGVYNIIKDIKSGKKNLDEDYDPYNVLGEK